VPRSDGKTQVQFLEEEVAKAQQRSAVGRQSASTGKDVYVEIPVVNDESMTDLLIYFESMASALRRSVKSLAEAVDRLDVG